MSAEYGIEIGKLPKADAAKPDNLVLLWDDTLQQAQLVTVKNLGAGGGGVDAGKTLTANWDAGPFYITLAGIRGRNDIPLQMTDATGQGMRIFGGKINLTAGITEFDLSNARLINSSGAAVTMGIISADDKQAKIGDVALITKAGAMTTKTLTVTGETSLGGQATGLNKARIYSPASPDKTTWPAELIPLPQAVRPLEKSVWLAHSAKPGYGYFVNDDASLLMHAAADVKLMTDGLIEVMTDTKKDANNNPIRYIYVDADGYLTLGGKGLKLNFQEFVGTGEIGAKTLTGDNPTLTFSDNVGAQSTWDIGLRMPKTNSTYQDVPEFHVRPRNAPDWGIAIVGSTTGKRVILKPITGGTSYGAGTSGIPTWSNNAGYTTWLGEPQAGWDGIYITNTKGLVVPSDERTKTDVRDTALGLDFIRKLRPVDYVREMTGASEHGFIAQEIEPLGFAGHSVDDNGYHWLHPLNFFAPIVKALQEIEQRLSALEGYPIGHS